MQTWEPNGVIAYKWKYSDKVEAIRLNDQLI